MYVMYFTCGIHCLKTAIILAIPIPWSAIFLNSLWHPKHSGLKNVISKAWHSGQIGVSTPEKCVFIIIVIQNRTMPIIRQNWHSTNHLEIFIEVIFAIYRNFKCTWMYNWTWPHRYTFHDTLIMASILQEVDLRITIPRSWTHNLSFL